jgi:bifunctional DNA-binding transcriptional regulator/antitoxin component of YhaV-PrlF toxin-antitoxin module
MKTHREYTGTIAEDDNGELVLVFSKEFINEMGWQEGDSIIWDVDELNRVVIVKKDTGSGD